MIEKGFRLEIPVHIKRDRRAQKILAKGDTSSVQDQPQRIARLLALAWKWEGMIRQGEAGSTTDIARLFGLSRARIAQVTSLTLLAPSVQLAVIAGRAQITEKHLRSLVTVIPWDRQRSSLTPSA